MTVYYQKPEAWQKNCSLLYSIWDIPASVGA
jgi:hypothetical protein